MKRKTKTDLLQEIECLQHRIAELEAKDTVPDKGEPVIDDITEHKQKENKITHLNTVLHAIRNINQLIIEEKDRRVFIRKACKILTRTHVYTSAWIILVDHYNKLTASASTGLGNKFKQIEDQFRKGILNKCCKRALRQPGIVIINDIQKECPECSPSNTESTERAFTIRLEHTDKIYGLLSVSLPKDFKIDPDEQNLFQELANDIGFALHNIELEEKQKRAKQKLIESEERYRNYFEKDLGGIYKSTPEGKLLECNHSFARMLGYESIEEILNVNALQFYHAPVQRNDFIQKIKQMKFLNNWETELKRKDGKKIFCIENVIGIFDDNHELVQFQGYILDITERRQKEEELRLSETILQKAQQVAQVGNWTWHIPKNQLEWSNEMYSIFGIKKETFTGDLADVIIRSIHPDDRAEVERANRILIQEKKPTPLEYRVIRPDGTVRVVWAEAGKLILDEKGKPEVLTGIVQDITEQKKLENSLIEEKRKLGTLISNVPGMVYRCHNDKFWTMNYVSDGCKTLTGYLPKDLIENSKIRYSEIIHPDDRQYVWKKIHKVPKKEDFFKLEYRIIDSQGREKWVFEQGKGIPDGKNRQIMLEGIIIDITDRKKAESRLAFSEERFRTLYETMSQGVVYQDADGRIISANPAAEHILGLTVDQMTGRKSIDSRWRAIHEDGSDFPGESHPSMIALKTGEPVKNMIMGVYNPVKKDRVWINIHAIPQFRSGEKRPYQVYTTFEDITKQRKMINELRSREERLKILFEFAPDTYYLTDIQGNIIDGNRQAEKLIGQNRENLIGKNILKVLKLGKDDKRKAIKSLAKNALGLSTERDEFTITRPDGFRVVTEVSAHPIKIGTESLVLGIARDITEPKKMEKELDNYRQYLEEMIKDKTEKLKQALEDSENNRDRIDTILKSVGEGLIVTDINHHILLINPIAEDWLGIRFSEVFNRNIEVAIADSKLKSLIKQTLASNTEKSISNFEIKKKRPAIGFILEVRSRPILDKQRKEIGVLTTLRDVTQERRIDQMKTEFISTVAHELRTPLTSIQGFSEILLTRNNIKTEEKKKFLNYIHKQAINVGNIISDLLDISRIESGVGFMMNRKKFRINDIIENLIGIYKISHPQYTFISCLEEKNLDVFADSEKIEHVMQNLLDNAINYSSPGSQIKVSTDILEEKYKVTIEDNGIGMTPEQVSKIFDKFYRADTSDNAPKGSGLGMSIVKYIIDAHKGKIWIESKPNKGTRVNFTLPMGLREYDRINDKMTE